MKTLKKLLKMDTYIELWQDDDGKFVGVVSVKSKQGTELVDDSLKNLLKRMLMLVEGAQG